MSATHVATLLTGEHSALHVNFQVGQVAGLQEAARADGAELRILSVAGLTSLQAAYHYLSAALDFPLEADSWDAVEDWVGDLEWLENAVGYIVVINDCAQLAAWPKNEFERFCELWPGGVAAYQYQSEIYHAVFTGPDDFGGHRISDVLRRRAERLNACSNHTQIKENPIPLVDHLSGKVIYC